MKSLEINVYVIKGFDPNGNLVELAKFFRPEHAERHLTESHYPRVAAQGTHRDVGIVIRKERASEQHPAHWDAIGYAP